jgi:hypothetical protein
MAAQILWICGSAIYLMLSTLHLLYTFFTNKFLPKDWNAAELMKQTHPLLSSELNMWKAWIGFNGSHSIGGIFLGSLNIIMAVFYFKFLAAAWPVIILTILCSLFYLFLAVNYWFKTPLKGIALATICYIAASILIFMQC